MTTLATKLVLKFIPTSIITIMVKTTRNPKKIARITIVTRIITIIVYNFPLRTALRLTATRLPLSTDAYWKFPRNAH